MKHRRFSRDVLNHCYQRTADNGILFYSYRDHLVYFTTYCICARRYGIQVLGLCQMPDHVHDSTKAKRKEQLASFKRDLNTHFSTAYNKAWGTNGPVWDSPFGSAPKHGVKQIRTNLIYLGNNPVERNLVKTAEQYRWNFLAYSQSDHPFSEPLVIRRASWHLQNAIKEVKARFKAGKPMTNGQLNRIYAPLQPEEAYQLTDYIISIYNVIDYQATQAYFGGYDNMLAAMHATTGNEYDLKESFVGKSDAVYYQMTSILLRELKMADIHDILSFSSAEKYEAFQLLRRETDALSDQIAKFLHLPIKKNR